MASHFALTFARSPAVVLFHIENDNMWRDWEDYIVATRTKRGIYSVLARKFGDQFVDGKTKKKWFLIHSVKNIKEPEDFIKAVKESEAALNVDVYWDDLVAALSDLDPEFSQEVSALVG